MSYLIDTNILSDLAPTKKNVPGAIHAWLKAHQRDLYLSVVTITEIEYGIDRLRHRKARARADRIAQWLDAIVELYAERILALDIVIARETGRLLAKAQAAGIEPGFEDAAIAATAKQHDLTVVTRNTRHFVPLGVAHINPTAG